MSTQASQVDGPRTNRTRGRARRQPPYEFFDIQFSFHSFGVLTHAPPLCPIRLTLELTNGNGELASWFDEPWWTDRLAAWGDRTVVVHVAPTPEALLNPLVLRNVEAARRLAPPWRLIGHAFSGDVVSAGQIEQLAASPYHEVRVADPPRESAEASQLIVYLLPTEELFRRVHEAQARLARTTPVLVVVRSNGAGESRAVRDRIPIPAGDVFVLHQARLAVTARAWPCP